MRCDGEVRLDERSAAPRFPAVDLGVGLGELASPCFSNSSFPIALPLGASSSTVHATGDRAKARVGEPWWEPRNHPFYSLAGAGPSATQVARGTSSSHTDSLHS